MNTVRAPFGSWPSPISAEQLASNAVELSSPKEVGRTLYFSETRPSEKGRTALVGLSKEGIFKELLPPEYSARTRVHEYGGGSVLIVGETLYFSNFSDQQLYKRDSQGVITQLTHEANTRFADGALNGDLLVYVAEIHGKTVENCLVSIDPRTGAVEALAQGRDFYSSPRSNSEGTLAYYCWDHPNMPWDGGELHVGERIIAGGENESICQFAWGPDDLLYFVSDRTGWWNLYREKAGIIESLCPLEAEFGSPQWLLGQSSFGFWGNDKLICKVSQNGIDFLAHLLLEGGELKRFDLPFTSYKDLSITGDHLYFIGASAQMASCLVQVDLRSHAWKILKKSYAVAVDPKFISVARPIAFPTSNGLSAHALYYPPKHALYQGLAEEKPPLLVLSHGGPTTQCSPSLNLKIQYWTTRGIAVIDVNYGGSSGYGRVYRDRLKGNWGLVDVEDCIHAALYCVQQEGVDPNRLAIAGGSAGGYTTLAALTFHNTFHAGASFYGVSDLEALAQDTHKFEARYLDKLIGPYPETKKIYRARSPIHHVEQIRCPVILLQGDEDAIVPPPQSEKMYRSLAARGIPTAYLLFEKEQHGFRQAANIKRSIEAELYFFSKIFGFTPADPIKPVEIANM